ncbi:MAG: C-GCAxxG-C-C family protein [Carboxylicivirga sp.]|jgi:hypothetical protein|nr:C-GCAxxG-C-C family protein [Carboxylicivirga sp.]
MNRRSVLKLGVGALFGGSATYLALTKGFRPDKIKPQDDKRLEYKAEESSWTYKPLVPSETAEIAYDLYKEGGCMYAVGKSIISQLANRYGEPYSSFPMQVLKYGHGGIEGFGTTCGTLNGAAAVVSLLISDKKVKSALVAELFQWYQETSFPIFVPQKPIVDTEMPVSIAGSPLCHVSTSKWIAISGKRIESKERKERCRRLSSDVANKTVELLNKYVNDEYVAHDRINTSRECMACHGSKGKLGNTSGMMDCDACHDKSVGHKLFGDIHYKYMDKRK